MTDDPFRRLAPVVRLAPAKLNLTLAILGRRSDGFHLVHSVALPLALADRLSVAPAAGREDTLHVTGHDTGRTEQNLVLRAIRVARTAVGRAAATVPLAFRLEKRIPVAAGLGGGSSDAAAAIDAALEAWQVNLADEAIDRWPIAARIGSDVPFFLAGGPALIEGRGERVTPLPDLSGQSPGVLLVTPGLAISTADAYAAFETGSGATRLTSEHLAGEWRAGLSGAALVARSGVLAAANDLAPAAHHMVPQLLPFRRALTRALGRPIGQSGSGPTLWALYPSLDAAAAAAIELDGAVDAGRLPAPGDRRPTIVATTILRRDPSGLPSGPASQVEDEEGPAR